MSFQTVSQAKARLNRCELAVSGSSPKFFEKAAKSEADIIFLDLEEDEDAEGDCSQLEAGGCALPGPFSQHDVHGFLHGVVFVCVDQVCREWSVHQASFQGVETACSLSFTCVKVREEEDGWDGECPVDFMQPFLTVCHMGPDGQLGPPLLRLEEVCIMDSDPYARAESWYRVCVGEDLQRALDSPLPGWAALCLGGDGQDAPGLSDMIMSYALGP